MTGEQSLVFRSGARRYIRLVEPRLGIYREQDSTSGGVDPLPSGDVGRVGVELVLGVDLAIEPGRPLSPIGASVAGLPPAISLLDVRHQSHFLRSRRFSLE